MSARVCMVGTHMPSRPQARNAAAVPAASFTPATRQATRAPIAVTPAQPTARRARYTARTARTTTLLTWPKK
ncbi:hypothetical protein SVIOM342S_04629 [Streptomyces violaceorubidus]